MKFVLEIELGNDAMKSRGHIVGALRKVLKKIAFMGIDGKKKIMDVNGNSVGFFELKKE